MTDGGTEADTRAEYIGPILAAAGWGQDGSKVRREVICPGVIQSRLNKVVNRQQERKL